MKKRILILILLFISSSFLWIKNVNDTISNQRSLLLYDNYQTYETKTSPYYGILKIPKIELEQGYFAKENNQNTVEKNIEQISLNCHPEENCTILLAAHSGNSNISYFKNLVKLTIGDQAYILKDQKLYTYQLKAIDYQQKSGYIVLPKNTYQLVLTTCSKKNSQLQEVYLFQKINL